MTAFLLILACMIGGIAGFAICAILTVSKNSDEADDMPDQLKKTIKFDKKV